MRVLQLDRSRFGYTIYIYREIDSTQNKALELARQGAKEGVVVVTQVQTQGRGREKKYWISEKGGLYFSIIYRPQTSITSAYELTKIIGLCVKRVIEKIVSKVMPMNLMTRGINDLLLNNRKLIGILVETEVYASDQNRSQPNFYVLGIGVNVNQNHFPRHYESIATSLKIETARYFSRFKIMKAIMEALSTTLPN